MSLNFLEFAQKHKTQAATIPTDELSLELEYRKALKPFPIHVFPNKLNGYIDALNKNYNIPRAFIGSAMISALSTAIGTAYVCGNNEANCRCMSTWICLTGLSSSGKSLGMNKVFAPLQAKEEELTQDWEAKTGAMGAENRMKMPIKKLIIKDIMVPTLIRTIIPDNPKGLLKHDDELLGWINGFNAMAKGKETTDEQFWLSSWDGAPYDMIRSGKEIFRLKRIFVNICGSTQYILLKKFFAKDRDATGFIFRLLFAIPEYDKICEPEIDADIPIEHSKAWADTIGYLLNDLEVNDQYDEPKKAIFTKEAQVKLKAFRDKLKGIIDANNDFVEKDIMSGIFGKINDYVIRFAGILAVADTACKESYKSGDYFNGFPKKIDIDSGIIERAIELGDYYFNSAITAWRFVNSKAFAPVEVIQAAHLLKSGKSIAQIADIMLTDKASAKLTDAGKKSKMGRKLTHWIGEYPAVFGAYGKRE
jgi:Protein of unknown function (DUF3987)